MPGAEYCRGYIQNWLQGSTIPERSAQRIFAAADKILKAGIQKTEGGADQGIMPSGSALWVRPNPNPVFG